MHSRFAAHRSKKPGDVQRLLDAGLDAGQTPRWRAIIDASATLTSTPSALDPGHIAALRNAGLYDGEISDVVHGTAFFNWANRSMQSLGEPTPPSKAG